MVEIAWRYNYGERTSATGHGTATESNCRATAGGADGVLDGAGNFAMGQSSRGVIHTGDESSLDGAGSRAAHPAGDSFMVRLTGRATCPGDSFTLDGAGG